MSLAFSASATIGSLRYDTHVTDARVTLALAPAVGAVSLGLPSGVRFEAGVGDEFRLSLRGENGDTPVFGGLVSRIDYWHDRYTVQAVDALGRLAAARPAQTFEQQSAGNVIRAIASDRGIPVGSIEDGPEMLTYVADQGRTALEHAVQLATWAGGYLVSNSDGALSLRLLPSGPADRALRFGREIQSLEVSAVESAADLIWVGSGPAGNVSAPDAHLHTTGVIPEGAPAPAPTVLRRAASALRTPSAARDATSATATRNSDRRISIVCWLQPEVRPGTVVEIADSPAEDGQGPWFITMVTHELGPGPQGRTRISGERLTEGSGLMGQLLGALGDLL